jgi:UDP-glucose 4-epimerase
VIETARLVTGREIVTILAPRRAGDPAQLIASSEKIRNQLGWRPEFQDLRVIIQSAWDWLSAHPKGYVG